VEILPYIDGFPRSQIFPLATQFLLRIRGTRVVHAELV
jgi:hypothetical protein